MAGKGDAPRYVDPERFADGWNRIFLCNCGSGQRKTSCGCANGDNETSRKVLKYVRKSGK